MRFALQFFILIAASLPLFGQSNPYPGTAPLTGEGDLSAQMVEGIDRFLERETDNLAQDRGQEWTQAAKDQELYPKFISTKRDHLRQIIGAVDVRISPTAIELVASSLQSNIVAESTQFVVRSVRWPVFPGVHGEGLWLRPKSPARGWIIALPDADQTPEMLVGLEDGIAHQGQFARHLAQAGFEVFVPVLINRSDSASGNAELNKWSNQPHREWIYRQAYQLGHHIIGYEVQKVLSLVDWIKTQPSAKVAIAGYGESGLIALHAAALDERIEAALVSGYFTPRENVWQEPIYRNLFGFLKEFGDAELAAMIAPRALIVEHSLHPSVSGPPASRPGRSGAAPGAITTPERYMVEEEFQRAEDLLPSDTQRNFHLIYGNEGATTGPGSTAALRELALAFDLELEPRSSEPPSWTNTTPATSDAAARQLRQVEELVAHTQGLLLRSERVRNAFFWKDASATNQADWAEQRTPLASNLWVNVLGKLPSPSSSPNPRSRQIYSNEKWTGYDVVLDVAPDVFAWGVLLVPNDLKSGERRPVVVCQHGLEGLPKDTIEGPENSGYRAYKSFSAKLAERGFIVFAPHNPYRGEDRFRVLQRKANPIGLSLFSVILQQHEQILNWLESLPVVDPDRIAFYGLSYGGKTAMRVPSLLDRYSLSICSADFNEWIRKNATVHSPYSYLFTGEYEMPEFNLGQTFNYAEMAALIAPRPFMVERGHHDGVAPDEWVAYEFAKVRRFYAQLGIPDRTEIEFFNGPHTINGQGTFDFLHKHLNWPAPAP